MERWGAAGGTEVGGGVTYRYPIPAKIRLRIFRLSDIVVENEVDKKNDNRSLDCRRVRILCKSGEK